MYNWRITKYDPLNRDESGGYLDSEEWTSYSEVGKKLNEEEYLIVEQKYINAIKIFMTELGIKKLQIMDLESYLEEDSTQTTTDFISNLSAGDKVSFHEVERLAQLTLREVVWCKLEFEDELYVHFGYDYYMYIGINKECKRVVQKIEKSGLFVENFTSPYL